MTKERIMDAARKVFAEYGHDRANMRLIARSAGISVGGLYLYFKNKDDLLISLFEEEFGKFVENMRAELEQEKDALQKIKRFAIIHLSIVSRQQQLAEVLENGHVAADFPQAAEGQNT